MFLITANNENLCNQEAKCFQCYKAELAKSTQEEHAVKLYRWDLQLAAICLLISTFGNGGPMTSVNYCIAT